MELNKIDKDLLKTIADLHDIPEGAYNIRKDGKLVSRSVNSMIDIVSKTDKSGECENEYAAYRCPGGFGYGTFLSWSRSIEISAGSAEKGVSGG